MKRPEDVPLSGSSRWANYEFLLSPITFHGCDQSVGEAILRGKVKHLAPSENLYDWLGTGIYFWEGKPERALQFALERAAGGCNSRGKIKNPLFWAPFSTSNAAWI